MYTPEVFFRIPQEFEKISYVIKISLERFGANALKHWQLREQKFFNFFIPCQLVHLLEISSELSNFLHQFHCSNRLLSSHEKYDFIFAGAGLSGLSLAYKIKKHPELKSARILLIDPSKKQSNDRTWCFWSEEEDYFDSLVFRKWENILFASHSFEKQYDIRPYQYKMIRGIDFYQHVIPFLESQDACDFIHAPVQNISGTQQNMIVGTGSANYSGKHVFKSYYDKPDFSKSHFVWQHFKGWIINTEQAAFDPHTAHFMDFRVHQDGETRFFYVLPFDKHRALVEIAIFSSDIPESSFYDPFLKDYIHNILNIDTYSIEEEELGAIPMTSYNFNQQSIPGITSIGTNAGSVKASSGYAFKRIQDETDRIISFLEESNLEKYRPITNRYAFYDKILLNAILSQKATGEEVFEKLFMKLKPQTIFRFLDEKGGILNDFKLFTAPPKRAFTSAFLEELVKIF